MHNTIQCYRLCRINNADDGPKREHLRSRDCRGEASEHARHNSSTNTPLSFCHDDSSATARCCCSRRRAVVTRAAAAASPPLYNFAPASARDAAVYGCCMPGYDANAGEPAPGSIAVAAAAPQLEFLKAQGITDAVVLLGDDELALYAPPGLSGMYQAAGITPHLLRARCAFLFWFGGGGGVGRG
jgi:hypothetical protein